MFVLQNYNFKILILKFIFYIKKNFYLENLLIISLTEDCTKFYLIYFHNFYILKNVIFPPTLSFFAKYKRLVVFQTNP